MLFIKYERERNERVSFNYWLVKYNIINERIESTEESTEKWSIIIEVMRGKK